MAEQLTAQSVVAALEAEQDDGERAKVAARLAPGEPVVGVRMGTVFEIAKAHTGMPLAEVERLLAEPAYEPRLAAFCVLDFKARRRADDAERARLHDTYLTHHDRITSWDMVDRAAPRVVGAHLVGRDKDALRRLAASDDPLRRRTAVTAPLYYTRYGPAADLADGFAVAAQVAADPDPVVHKAVGIFLKHAGRRDEGALLRFLDAHAAAMARPAVRLALETLTPEQRAAY